MKTCFKCGIGKPREEFYRHPAMADGLLGKCKECTKKDVIAHRLANVERIRKYDLMRANRPHAVALRARVVAEWRRAHPGRSAAHTAAQRHHRNKPDKCSRCGGSERSLQRHHPDYSEPLKIEWVCKPRHVVADGERREREAHVND